MSYKGFEFVKLLESIQIFSGPHECLCHALYDDTGGENFEEVNFFGAKQD